MFRRCQDKLCFRFASLALLILLAAACAPARAPFDTHLVDEAVSVFEFNASRDQVYYIKQVSYTRNALWLLDLSSGEKRQLTLLGDGEDDFARDRDRALALLSDAHLLVQYADTTLWIEGDQVLDTYQTFYLLDLMSAEEITTWSSAGHTYPEGFDQRVAAFAAELLAASDHISYLPGFGAFEPAELLYFARDARGKGWLLPAHLLDAALGQPFHQLQPEKFVQLQVMLNPELVESVEYDNDSYPRQRTVTYTDGLSQAVLVHAFRGDCGPGTVVALQPCTYSSELRRSQQSAAFEDTLPAMSASGYLSAADGAIYLVTNNHLQAFR